MLGPPDCDSSSRRRHSDARRLDPRPPLARRDQGDDGRDQRATREEEQASFEAARRILEPADRDGADQATEVANRFPAMAAAAAVPLRNVEGSGQNEVFMP